MTASTRIMVDDRTTHPTLVFYFDRDTRDCVALDRETGYFVGMHRGDTTRGVSAVLIDAALRYEAPADRRVAS